jgi:hypothetical protein
VLPSCKLRDKPLDSIKEWKFLAIWRSNSLSSRTLPCGVRLGECYMEKYKILAIFCFVNLLAPEFYI